MLFVAEIFGDSETRKANAKTRAGRFSHLAVNQSGARLLRIARNYDASFLKFQPEIISFTSTFANARKHRNAAMLHRDVVDQFLNQHRLADARPAEQSDFPALQERLNQVNNFDPR